MLLHVCALAWILTTAVHHCTPQTLIDEDMLGPVAGLQPHMVAPDTMGAWQTKCWRKNKQQKGTMGVQLQATNAPPLATMAAPSNPTHQESQAP